MTRRDASSTPRLGAEAAAGACRPPRERQLHYLECEHTFTTARTAQRCRRAAQRRRELPSKASPSIATLGSSWRSMGTNGDLPRCICTCQVLREQAGAHGSNPKRSTHKSQKVSNTQKLKAPLFQKAHGSMCESARQALHRNCARGGSILFAKAADVVLNAPPTTPREFGEGKTAWASVGGLACSVAPRPSARPP